MKSVAPKAFFLTLAAFALFLGGHANANQGHKKTHSAAHLHVFKMTTPLMKMSKSPWSSWTISSTMMSQSITSHVDSSKLSAAEIWADTPAGRCIQFRESTTINGVTFNPQANNNIWQFEGGTWNGELGMPGKPGDFPRSVQNKEAYDLYLARKYQPWQADDYYCARFE